jgi:hypothetical protein
MQIIKSFPNLQIIHKPKITNSGRERRMNEDEPNETKPLLVTDFKALLLIFIIQFKFCLFLLFIVDILI